MQLIATDSGSAGAAKHLARCFGIMLGFDALAWWVLERNAGLTGWGPGFLAVILWCAGVCFFLVLLFERRQSNPIPVVLGLAVATLAFMYLGDMRAAAKNGLKPGDIGTQTAIADAVVTCVRKNVAWVDYAELEGWTVFYTYAADGELHRQYDYVLDTHLHIGDHMKVLYRLENPALARMMKSNERIPADADASPASAKSAPPLPVPNPAYIAC